MVKSPEFTVGQSNNDWSVCARERRAMQMCAEVCGLLSLKLSEKSMVSTDV